MPSHGFAIAVDGPASSGKGTVARLVARELGFAYVDTGSMYRAVALTAIAEGIDQLDGEALAARISTMRLSFGFDHGRFTIGLDGEDISRAIRTQEVGAGASLVATLPEVRRALLDTQRTLASEQGVVMDGRDIGTVVLPDADLKIYLDAESSVRAMRRHAELLDRGVEVSLQEVRSELASRDAQDSGRAHAPLARAADAVALDCTHRTPEEVAAKVVSMARGRLDARADLG
ncbi:MAG TPA: (d)CMP kinase [Myxococcota bacterium]|nr:(d)CMP kinase [Myxococcota bacterium]